MAFLNSSNDSRTSEPPVDPPSYSETQNEHRLSEDAPHYLSHSGLNAYGPNEFPQEKKEGFHSSGNKPYTLEANDVYELPPQQINIAFDTDGTHTRPGYKEFLSNHSQKLSPANGPQHQEVSGKRTPMEPTQSPRSSGRSGFPGSSGTTYYNSANK